MWGGVEGWGWGVGCLTMLFRLASNSWLMKSSYLSLYRVYRNAPPCPVSSIINVTYPLKICLYLTTLTDKTAKRRFKKQQTKRWEQYTRTNRTRGLTGIFFGCSSDSLLCFVLLHLASSGEAQEKNQLREKFLFN